MKDLKARYIEDLFLTDSGVGDGVETEYVLTESPKSMNSTFVFLNGLLVTTGVTLNIPTKTLTISPAPAIAQEIDVKYVRRGF